MEGFLTKVTLKLNLKIQKNQLYIVKEKNLNEPE